MTAAEPGPAPLTVVVVLPPRVLLLDVAGPVEVLRKANLLARRARFVVRFVGPDTAVHSSIGLGLSGVEPLPDHLPASALVLVPGTADEPLNRPAAEAGTDASAERAIVGWLARVVRPGVRLVSVCSGALLVARAGLLDGHDCTTHHAAVADLRRLAPLARVHENRLFVDSGERLTSAGVTAGVDLMLHLVAADLGPGVALAVARDLVVYLRRSGQDPQLSPWLDGRNHIHPAVHRAQDAVAADPARAWSVAALARVAAASPRHLSRLFNEHAGMGVTDYVNTLRVALAFDMVTRSRLSLDQVAERAGFASTRQFRRAWSRHHGRPPAQVRGAATATAAGAAAPGTAA